MKQIGFMELFTCPLCGSQEFHHNHINNERCQDCLVSVQHIKYEYLDEPVSFSDKVFLNKKDALSGDLCFQLAERIVK